MRGDTRPVFKLAEADPFKQPPHPEEKYLDIQAAGRQETKELEKRLLVLEVITAVAPLLGLLGTVLGLENIFGIISELGVRTGQGVFQRARGSYSYYRIRAFYRNSIHGCI